MRARLTGASAALALAVLAAPAAAQDPQPTPTPSPTATASPTPPPPVMVAPPPPPPPPPALPARAERAARDRKAKGVRSIYRDFERDGRIDDCDHTLRALKRARRSIADSYNEDYPDFRDALTAAIERHSDGDCEEQQQELEDRNSDPTPTPSATATPAPGPPPAAPPPTTPPPTTPDSGSLPDFGSGGSGGDSGGDVKPLPEQPAPPGEDAIPEGTASPTPAPQATPTPTPRLIVTRAAASPNMFVPGALLAVALLGLLIAALTALFAKRTGRLAGVGHAWREAAWRTSGAWSDFSDWLRSRR